MNKIENNVNTLRKKLTINSIHSRLRKDGGCWMNIELNKVQKILEWIRRKLYLETIASNARKRMVKRGQVYRCDFGIGIGSEMQKERPAIIVQNDIGNIHSSNTIVIPITH
ncbi:MAG: type II toxin-antitoxin system PemK/MazF family toxin, partial [Firmicutes bacterium]|nr:type II toxin-antitoxin system PemK/MazF family toxin [Bacillota bacterium]